MLARWAAPVLPGAAANTATWPRVPLCASGAAAGSMPGSRSSVSRWQPMAGSLSNGGGKPAATTRIAPTAVRVAGRYRQRFGNPIVTVAPARTSGPPS